MNIFVIESTDTILINSYIEKIIKDKNLNIENVIRYDMTVTSIDSVIEDLDTYNLLMDSKLIICKNSYFLSSGKVKSLVEHNLKNLKKYVDKPNSLNYLIMICDKFSDRKEIKELIKDVKIVNDKFSIEDVIKDRLKNYKMDNATINYLINYCMNDNEKIISELEKLKIYKIDEKIITKEDIEECVLKSYDDNVFDLVNAIAKRNRDLSFSIYERLITKEKDTTLIIASIANNIRTLYTTKILMKSGYSIDKIAEDLGVKRGAISIAYDNGKTYSEKQLLKYLNILADIDMKTKKRISNNNLAFELFILNL